MQPASVQPLLYVTHSCSLITAFLNNHKYSRVLQSIGCQSTRISSCRAFEARLFTLQNLNIATISSHEKSIKSGYFVLNTLSPSYGPSLLHLQFLCKQLEQTVLRTDLYLQCSMYTNKRLINTCWEASC